MADLKRLAAAAALAFFGLAGTAASAAATTVTPVDGTTLKGSLTLASNGAEFDPGFAKVNCSSVSMSLVYTEDGTLVVTAINFSGCKDSLGRPCVIVTDNTLDATTASGKLATTMASEDDFTLTLTITAGKPGSNGITINVTCTGFLGTTTCTFRADGTVAGTGTSGTIAGTTIGTGQSTSATITVPIMTITRTAGSSTCSNPTTVAVSFTVTSVTPSAPSFTVTS